MKPPTIASQWSDFERAVIPQEAPDVQRKEMRKAFYAGVSTILSLREKRFCNSPPPRRKARWWLSLLSSLCSPTGGAVDD